MKLDRIIENPLFALIMFVLAMGLIPLNDAIVKILSERMPISEIILVRTFICLGILILFGDGLRRVFFLPLRVLISFVGRGMCLVFSMYLYFLSLASLPLATVVSIFFTAPLLITIFSRLFLGEIIGIHRIVSVAVGMLGALLIIKPGAADFQLESLIALGAALFYALFQIWTRRLKSVGNLSALVTVQHLCYLAAAIPLFWINLQNPLLETDSSALLFLLRGPIIPTLPDILFLSVCAVTVLFLSMASSNVYRKIQASLIAPFEYIAIPLSVFWGVFIWGDWPSKSVWLGILFILSGGLYSVYRQWRKELEGKGELSK